jgi:hypothetical protein
MAGRLGSNTRQSGEILINGHKQKLAFGTSVRVGIKEIFLFLKGMSNIRDFFVT